MGSLHAELAKLPLTRRSVHPAVWEGRTSGGFGLSGDLGPHRYAIIRLRDRVDDPFLGAGAGM